MNGKRFVYTPEERLVLIKKYMKEFNMSEYEAELRVQLFIELNI